MPRYHYHVRDGALDTDVDGVELPNLAAVRREAVMFAAQCMLDKPIAVWDGNAWTVEVTDETGLVLYTLSVSAKPRSIRRSTAAND